MRVRVTDQAALAVALARAAAAETEPTVAHLLVGLATEPEGRAGRRLRARPTAAALLRERASATEAPPLGAALSRLAAAPEPHVADTVELLDAALAEAGRALQSLLVQVGYHRDLDGWLTTDPVSDWYEDAETYGFDPAGDAAMEPSAARVVAQVRAVNGGAVELVVAVAAAPDGASLPDPRALAAIASRLQGASDTWDAGLDAIVSAAQVLSEGMRLTVDDLLRAALVAGGDGPRLVLQLATADPA